MIRFLASFVFAFVVASITTVVAALLILVVQWVMK